MPLRLLILLIFNVLCATLVAQVSARAEMDSNVVETGNPFVIHVYSPRDAGRPLSIDFRAWQDIIPAENILSQSEPIFTDDGQFEVDVTVLHFDADTLRLPPLLMRLNGGDSALTNPLEIVVMATPSPDDLNDLAPIKDIHREVTLWWDYWPLAAGIAAIVGVVLLLFWWYRRSQGPTTGAILRRNLRKAPAELARQKMAALAKKQLWQKGQVKAYYAELTYILREYVQHQHGIPALESTTEEWVNALKINHLFPDNHAMLAELGRLADLAKFAKGEPPAAFHDEAFRAVERVIGA